MMSLIQQGAFNLKNCLMRPIAQKLYRSVKKEALLSDEERQELAFERARTLVKTAFDNCDFYREKYRQAGLDDGMIQSMSDFSRLPPLEKQDIRNYRQEMCNRTVRSLRATRAWHRRADPRRDQACLQESPQSRAQAPCDIGAPDRCDHRQ